jgi:membrane protease YdiL (CAAX protease family)
MRKRPLLLFFVLTFAITWGLGACYAMFPDRLVALFGPISNANPLFYVAVYAPSLSALIVTAYVDGIPGLRELLSRLLRWRVGLQWYLIVFLGMPSLIVGSAALTAWFSGESFDFEKGRRPWALYPILLSLVLDPGPLGEELGWRGFALPRLLHRHSALTASVIVGLIWGLWHLPAFFISGLPQNQLSLPAFFVGCVALSVLMTWVYQHTQGSLLFAILIHWLFNTDFLPRGTLPVLTAVLTLAALVAVGVSRPAWLSRTPASKVEPGRGMAPAGAKDQLSGSHAGGFDASP